MIYVRHGRSLSAVFACALVASALALFPLLGRADEPYARSRDYDLRNVKTHLWFDTDQRKVRGEVTHSISMFRDGLTTDQVRLCRSEYPGCNARRPRRQIFRHAQ